jgi:FtsH-binding integral membrane protein
MSSSGLPFNSTNISLNAFKKNVYTLLSCVLITSSILATLIKTS